LSTPWRGKKLGVKKAPKGEGHKNEKESLEKESGTRFRRWPKA